MSLYLTLKSIKEQDRLQVGGKAFALAMLSHNGMRVPNAIVITVEAYNQFLNLAGLATRIGLELNRKSIENMRWEEMWDASLRIRNMFITTEMPPVYRDQLMNVIENSFQETSVAVRSSAPGEDTAETSFAGLHESYLNIHGAESILNHIKRVWASLWSDAALLYREQLGLDIEKSSMAVLVQEIVAGEKSGIVFSVNPADATQAVIEAVHGLNEGLVSGQVEPDMWVIDRQTGHIEFFRAAQRYRSVVLLEEGVQLQDMSVEKAAQPPLKESEVNSVYQLALSCEKLFNYPQDCEWTFKGDRLFILQSRPITARLEKGTDESRSWYLSLRRTFENLRELRKKIESELIPDMINTADILTGIDLTGMTEKELYEEVVSRANIFRHWTEVYRREFIPFAHGIRLFGSFYNDEFLPSDPYEFMDLLSGTSMLSVQRNNRLEELAEMIRDDAKLAEALEAGCLPEGKFLENLELFLKEFGDVLESALDKSPLRETAVRVILEMANKELPNKIRIKKNLAGLLDRFLSHFGPDRLSFAEEILDIARTSYRLRDDDNIYMGRLKTHARRAFNEYSHKVKMMYPGESPLGFFPPDVSTTLSLLLPSPANPDQSKMTGPSYNFKARQMVGQPSGPGLATGIAHVFNETDDLSKFKSGEVLVCDALDPTMTFLVPLVVAIVERRGGMLIHGSIIAREYGIPCVTGVPGATELIKTGDSITVDGHLGIVIINS
jgi:pyruvate,water dikinase